MVGLETLRFSKSSTTEGKPSEFSQQILDLKDISIYQEELFRRNVQILRDRLQ
jgi:hypothetical protein